MGSSFSTSTVFKGVDRMSPVFDKMSKRSSRFGDTLKAVLAGAAIQRGIGMLTSGLKSITSEFIDFEGALISSGAKFKGLNVATEEGQAQLKLLGETAREVGATTIFSATEAAQGLDFLAMAGFNVTEAIVALPAVTNLAVVAQMDLATATDIASDSLGAFGLDVNDLTRLNDVFAKTMTTSNTDMTNLFEAIKKGAPTFTSAGQSLESFNALVGVMANSGVKGSEAGTALRNVMLKLASPTSEAAGVMKDLNIKTQDQFGNFRDVIDIIGDFETGLDGMGSAQRTAALATVFGARTVTGINLLLQEGSEGLRTYRDDLLGASGASDTMAGVIGSSLGNRLKGLKSAVIEAGFTFVEVFSDKAGGTIDKLTETVRSIDLSSLAENMSGFIDRLIINLPTIKQQFMDLLPQIKETANQIISIAGTIAIMLADLATLTSGPVFSFLKWTAENNILSNMGKSKEHFEGGGSLDDWMNKEAPNQSEANGSTANFNQTINATSGVDIDSSTSVNGAPAINKSHLMASGL